VYQLQGLVIDDVAFCVRYRPAMRRFEVTKERLGVYLPTEHIDNPKDYADNEDARKYDPRLRGPVDPRTGMKNCECRRLGWGLGAASGRSVFDLVLLILTA
jgi:hypothetical protein